MRTFLELKKPTHPIFARCYSAIASGFAGFLAPFKSTKFRRDKKLLYIFDTIINISSGKYLEKQSFYLIFFSAQPGRAKCFTTKWKGTIIGKKWKQLIGLNMMHHDLCCVHSFLVWNCFSPQIPGRVCNREWQKRGSRKFFGRLQGITLVWARCHTFALVDFLFAGRLWHRHDGAPPHTPNQVRIGDFLTEWRRGGNILLTRDTKIFRMLRKDENCRRSMYVAFWELWQWYFLNRIK